jgi:hypothetical protein
MLNTPGICGKSPNNPLCRKAASQQQAKTHTHRNNIDKFPVLLYTKSLIIGPFGIWCNKIQQVRNNLIYIQK